MQESQNGTIMWQIFRTNLVEKSVVHKTVINVCQVLVMKLDHFSNKNLNAPQLSQFPHQKSPIKFQTYYNNMTLPVLADRPHLSYLPVKNHFLALQ